MRPSIRSLFIAVCAGLLLASAGAAATQEGGDAHAGHDHASHAGSAEGVSSHGAVRRSAPWPEEAKHAFAELPVQDGGRVKPLDSIAGLRLLTLNGKRSLKLEDGTRLDPRDWLLDVLFFPAQAREYPCFRVQTDAVPVLMGIEAKGKRAWYSYEELLPGRQKLADAARALRGVEAAKQTEVERQTLKLAGDMLAFENLLGTLEFTRVPYETGASPGLRELYGPEPHATLSEVLGHAAELRTLTTQTTEEDVEEYDAVRALFGNLGTAMDLAAFSPALFPPPPGLADEETWRRSSDIVEAAFTPGVDVSRQIELLAGFERLEAAKHDPEAFTAEMQALTQAARGLAEARGEYGHIPLEVKLYDLDPFWRSLYLYLLAFVFVALGWLMPRARWTSWGAWISLLGGFALVTTGIVMRCVIRERPPVVSLYDTILFVTASGTLVLLFLEYVTRWRVALSVGALFGVAGMFLAGKYEAKEVASAGDTMASVIAVLDTNYYLAIHVTTVTWGYVGGLVAGLLAHVWILGRLFGLKKGDEEFYRGLSRMIYGVLCFCLFFALFGTIMGGVWANDSWGRFWGWDPKENGALIICLWVLMALHARLGGYVRDRGMAVLAVCSGVVVSASWWGVNLLNVGLHSYGFTSGVARSLYIFWSIEALVLIASGIDWLAKRGLSDAGGGAQPPVSSQAGGEA